MTDAFSMSCGEALHPDDISATGHSAEDTEYSGDELACAAPDVDDLSVFSEEWFSSRQGTLFVYDLETVPDESVCPRPSASSDSDTSPADIDVDSVLKTNATVDAAISSGEINRATAAMLLSIEQSSKMRKGVISSLTAVADADEKEFAEWSKMSFNPWGCRIVAMSVYFWGDNRPVVAISDSSNQEQWILSFLWKCFNTGIRSGYNIEAFDDRVVVARSLLLGVTPQEPVETKRYGNKTRIDLYKLLFDGSSGTMKLKDLCVRLGIDIPAGPEMNGGMVRQLVDEGRWAEIADYVRSDAIVEMELLKRVRQIVQF